MVWGGEHGAMAAFVAVAEERSFRRAAARLGLNPSTLSHSLRSLEERLGVRLLNRTTRTVALTEVGASLLAEVAPAYRAVAAAVERVNSFRDRPRGVVRLSVPRLAATLLFAPRLSTFADTYPDVILEITVEDRFVDIVREGYDAGVRLGESVGGDMTAKSISGDLRGAVVGSAAYFREMPVPETPRDLERHRCINRRHDGRGAIHPWSFQKGQERIVVLGSGPLTSNSDDLMASAARDGVGLAFLSESDVAEDLAEGRLLRVLEEWCPPIGGFYIYHPRQGGGTASLRALIAVLTSGQ